MNLSFDIKLADGYTSLSQKIRVLTEDWVDRQIYCPNCGHLDIDQYRSNKPVADFFCSNCREDYELKSKKDNMGSRILDGAYGTMIKRLKSANNPNFFFLNYNLQNYKVQNFLVIPKHFFIPEIIEKRKALSQTARRAGWVGCNILIQSIPQSGKIFYIKNGNIESREDVLRSWQKTLFLRETKKADLKGWILDVMNCIDKLNKKEFTLSEIYKFENILSQKHPENKHVKDKIRQQLQFLRDRGYLEFIDSGKYKIS